MKSRLLFVGVLSGIVAAAFGCSPGITADSSLPNITDTTLPPSNVLYTINGDGPAGSFDAIALFDGASVRADQAFAFDLAFDIDSLGQAIVYPTSKIATSLSTPRRIGMQIVPGPYLSVTSAPKSNYSYDSTFHVPVGTILAIESDDIANCGSSITGSAIYAKIQVLSIDTAAKTLVVVFTVDRNCGFHSLLPNVVPSS